MKEIAMVQQEQQNLVEIADNYDDAGIYETIQKTDAEIKQIA